MHRDHRVILQQIKRVADSNIKGTAWHDGGKYMGTSRPIYNITNPQVRKIARTWAKEHANISVKELVLVLNPFFQGKSHTERSFGGKLLEYFPKLRKEIKPKYLDVWLTGAQGWEEVDSLCQSTFTAEEVLSRWDEWKKLLNKLSKDKDVSKRRASLVLLVKPVGGSNDARLADGAFQNIERLKKEKDILITKAISWLLRSLIKNHRPKVAAYLKANQDSLPKIALRETRKKLLTGKK